MPHKHGLAAAASAAIAAIALGGCGGSSFGGGGHPGTTPPDGCSASTSSTAVGAICQARQVAAVAPAGGTPTNSIGNGTPLYKNEAITTG
ncbi:MAG TPA: hypothetical protein VGS19_00190, partial [Streptosporangiaceae bacterium]|nr:hypothetical protein [Streptosporangiaceae bacterium]